MKIRDKSGFINKNKLLKNMDNLVNKEPVTMDINLTNFCNQDCDYCRYKNGSKYMGFELFKKVINRGLDLGVKSFILTGGGEPLLNPDIEKIANYLDSRSISYGVNSNFTNYVDMEPKWLKIGFDGYSPTDYLNIRGSDDFSLVRDNIKKFKERHPSVVVSVQAVIKRKDWERVYRFYTAVKDLPVDMIIVRPLEKVYTIYTVDEIEKIDKEINSIFDKRVLRNYKFDLVNERFHKCYAQWSVLTVNYNGELWYCCHKPNEVVGSIFDDDILEKKREMHTDMSKCENPCRLSGNNVLVREIEKKGVHSEFV